MLKIITFFKKLYKVDKLKKKIITLEDNNEFLFIENTILKEYLREKTNMVKEKDLKKWQYQTIKRLPKSEQIQELNKRIKYLKKWVSMDNNTCELLEVIKDLKKEIEGGNLNEKL